MESSRLGFKFWLCLLLAAALGQMTSALGLSFFFLMLFTFGCVGASMLRSGFLVADSRVLTSSVVSLVTVHRLSCSEARETFSDQESNSHALCWKADS